MGTLTEPPQWQSEVIVERTIAIRYWLKRLEFVTSDNPARGVTYVQSIKSNIPITPDLVPIIVGEGQPDVLGSWRQKAVQRQGFPLVPMSRPRPPGRN